MNAKEYLLEENIKGDRINIHVKLIEELLDDYSKIKLEEYYNSYDVMPHMSHLIDMTEERMKEYIVNGGKLFTITSIDTIRDGGTKIIKTTKGDYYINKDSKEFNSSYSPSGENLITDPLLIEYLIDRIEKYIKKCEEDVERNKNLLIKIKNR